MIALEESPQNRPLRQSRRSPNLLDALDLGYVKAGFGSLLPLGGEIHQPLREMILDTLDHPGSLIRAQLAYLILKRTAVGAARARSLAVAIEYFHTASLIFDDMPMMDDSGERRGHPCAHRTFGEATATLGALALINQGYSLLWSALESVPRGRSSRATELVTRALGVQGLLDGQSRDLQYRQRAGGEEDVLEVASGKTVPLIRMTLVLPALVGGASEATLSWLERLSVLWGLSYQVLDDCKDCLASSAETGKSTLRDQELGRPNLCNALGLRAASARLREMLGEASGLMDKRPTHDWPELERLQQILEAELERIEQLLERLPTVPAVTLVSPCPDVA